MAWPQLREEAPLGPVGSSGLPHGGCSCQELSSQGRPRGPMSVVPSRELVQRRGCLDFIVWPSLAHLVSEPFFRRKMHFTGWGPARC